MIPCVKHFRSVGYNPERLLGPGARNTTSSPAICFASAHLTSTQLNWDHIQSRRSIEWGACCLVYKPYGVSVWMRNSSAINCVPRCVIALTFLSTIALLLFFLLINGNNLPVNQEPIKTNNYCKKINETKKKPYPKEYNIITYPVLSMFHPGWTTFCYSFFWSHLSS